MMSSNFVSKHACSAHISSMNPTGFPASNDLIYSKVNSDPGMIGSTPRRVLILDWPCPEPNSANNYITARSRSKAGGLASEPVGLTVTNMGYVDGHVEWLTRLEALSSSRMKAYGWMLLPGPDQ